MTIMRWVTNYARGGYSDNTKGSGGGGGGSGDR